MFNLILRVLVANLIIIIFELFVGIKIPVTSRIILVFSFEYFLAKYLHDEVSVIEDLIMGIVHRGW